MRNIVVHEYFGVSPQILWETLQTDLPLLEHQLQAIVASGGVDQA